MRSATILLCLTAALGAGSCRDREQAAPQANEQSPPAAAPAPPPEADPRTSPAAAADLVRRYAALVEKGDFAPAAKLWSDPGAAAQFAADLDDYPKVAMRVGEPADEEGAAGSIFITVPVTMTLTLRSGSPYEMGCKATLRRVNDVPGASAAQLAWSIQSIAC